MATLAQALTAKPPTSQATLDQALMEKPTFSTMYPTVGMDTPPLPSASTPWYGEEPGILAKMLQGTWDAVDFPAAAVRGEVDPTSDEGIARAADLAGLVTLGPGAIPGEGLRMGIKAFHGSPHDFDRFSMDKIGTGEGAQAYGHGLYFAENPAVAGEYKKALASGTVLDVAPETVAEREVIDRIRRYSDEVGGVPDDQTVRMDILNDQEKAGEWFSAYDDLLKRANPGRTYEVDIDASPNEFLDWDRPLGEQNPAVQSVFSKIFGPEEVAYMGSNPVEAVYNRAQMRGMTPEALTEAFNGAGIKGIRYKDAGSRVNPPRKLWDGRWQIDTGNNSPTFATEAEARKAFQAMEAKSPGTSNYVVFDANTINILKKYGLAGLTAGGAGAAMLGGSTDDASAAQPGYSTSGR